MSIRRDGGYVDPSNYIPERSVVLPKWTQLCDDYKVVYKVRLNIKLTSSFSFIFETNNGIYFVTNFSNVLNLLSKVSMKFPNLQGVTLAAGSIVGPSGRKEEDTSQDVPEDESLATDEMDESDRPGQDVQEIKSKWRIHMFWHFKRSVYQDVDNFPFKQLVIFSPC